MYKNSFRNSLIILVVLLMAVFSIPQEAFSGLCSTSRACCVEDTDCPAGQTCDDFAGMCDEFGGGGVPGTCDTGDDCNLGISCLESGICRGGDNDTQRCFLDPMTLGLCSSGFTVCRTDLDCSSGSYCILTGECPTGYCMDAETACTSDADCPFGDSCFMEPCDPGGEEGGCSNSGDSCRTDAHCTAPGTCLIYHTCVGPTGACSIPPTACSSDADCDTGETCTGNYPCCNESCGSVDPCPGGDCDSCDESCTQDGDCNDYNVCTTSACSAGICTHTNNTASCSDSNVCTTNDTCAAGSCVSGTAVDCDDSNTCTDDSCNTASGCQYTNNTAFCDDSNVCTISDTCADGSCAGTAISCDDGNSCTTDSCDPTTGCENSCNATIFLDPCCTDTACSGEAVCAVPVSVTNPGDGGGDGGGGCVMVGNAGDPELVQSLLSSLIYFLPLGYILLRIRGLKRSK